MLQSTLPSTLAFKPVEFDPFADGELMMAIPATASQQEVWLAVQMGRDANLAYNESSSLRLRGALNVDALRSSLQTLVQRHEALRTTFSADGSTLCIAASMSIDVPLIDLSVLASEDDRAAKLRQLIHHEVAERTFNIAHDQLFCAQLVRVSAQDHVLLLTAHHIVCDGWSWGVLLPELAALYSAAQQGTVANLEPAQRFSDYALLQAELPTTAAYAEAERYWLQQFSGQIPVLELPLDRPRPNFRNYPSDREDWTVHPSLVTNLKKVAAKAGCSFFTLLLTAFEVFLHRLSGQTDIVVGVPSAGQSFTDFDQLVGHCVNFLPIRSQIDGKQPFVDYMRARSPKILAAYDYQQLGFGDLVKKLAIPRDSSRVPLTAISFNLDRPLKGNDLAFAGLIVELANNARQYETFEIALNACEVDGQMVLECQYNTDLFTADTIRRRLQEFETLLTGIVTDASQPISLLPMMPETEWQLLQEWNATQTNYPANQCIHQLVETQAAKTPNAVAVAFENQHLTYQELNTKANQLAHHLQGLGVQPDTLVGLCMQRSLEMVVGLLGILKAGAAYVPIDPYFPADRVEYMLENAQANVLLTQQRLVNQLPTQGASVICIDTDWHHIAQASPHNPSSSVTPGNLAYVIYTSGSTGKPKGVQILHRGVVNFLTSMQQQPGIKPNDRLLSVTTLSFDIAVLEIFLPLTVGAQVVLISRESAMDGKVLAKTIADLGITILQATPATWRLLLETGWQGNKTLKMFSGGEAISRELAAKLLAKGAELWNLYGPTETTIWSTVSQVSAHEHRISIGKPIANTEIYILDANLQPVPIGVAGELHIGGAGVAKGYLNRPDLTAERFIPNPLSQREGDRIYKTGDLARYLPDGTIECLGRLDFQVKIRGFRIELGEIESAIVKDPTVKQAVVIVREDNPGDKRLVGYIVALGNQPPSASKLRSLLKGSLPDYMVPSAFVILDSLPLTPNGKVDRKALPAPDYTGVETTQADFVAPRDDLDVQLLKLWEKVLNVSPVKMQDNFFELGGHSLLAISMIAQLEKTYGKELPLSVLFRSPTVEALANTLREEGVQSSSQSLVTIQKGDSSKPSLFCIYGIFLYYDLARYLGADQPVYGIYLREEVDIVQNETLEKPSDKFLSISNLATRYLQEIQNHQPVGPYFLAGESLGGLVAFEIAQQLQAKGEDVALLCLLDSTIPGKDKPTLQQRLAFHRKNIAQQGLPYLLNRAKRKISQAKLQASSDIRVDFREYAFNSYRPQPYPGKAVLFRAMDESHFDSLQEWHELALGGLEVYDIPGDHLGILHEPHVQVLAENLKACIGRAIQVTSGVT